MAIFVEFPNTVRVTGAQVDDKPLGLHEDLLTFRHKDYPHGYYGNNTFPVIRLWPDYGQFLYVPPKRMATVEFAFTQAAIALEPALLGKTGEMFKVGFADWSRPDRLATWQEAAGRNMRERTDNLGTFIRPAVPLKMRVEVPGVRTPVECANIWYAGNAKPKDLQRYAPLKLSGIVNTMMGDSWLCNFDQLSPADSYRP